ncbi:MAG: hypothetical protein ACYTG0_25670 [Planctomycetota bacterium]
MREIPPRTTPQILFRNPKPPTGRAQSIEGDLELEIEVNTLDSIHLAGVIARFDDAVVWLQPRAPKPGEVTIPASALRGKDHKLSVSAVDNRGALGTHYVFVTAAR